MNMCGESSTGGAEKFINLEIQKFQKHHGLAIQRNAGDLQAVRTALWSTYFHKLSTDKDSRVWTLGSWCRYQESH
jgi:hypothetical protein